METRWRAVISKHNGNLDMAPDESAGLDPAKYRIPEIKISWRRQSVPLFYKVGSEGWGGEGARVGGTCLAMEIFHADLYAMFCC